MMQPKTDLPGTHPNPWKSSISDNNSFKFKCTTIKVLLHIIHIEASQILVSVPFSIVLFKENKLKRNLKYYCLAICYWDEV